VLDTDIDDAFLESLPRDEHEGETSLKTESTRLCCPWNLLPIEQS